MKSNKESFWSQLEAAGLGQIVMVERIRALRALHNAAGGPLSVKKKAEDPATELTRLLRSLIAEDA